MARTKGMVRIGVIHYSICMANATEVAEKLKIFEGAIESIRSAYPVNTFSTPDRALEKYVSFLQKTKQNSDFEGIRREARNIYNFFEDRIPHSPKRDFYLTCLLAARGNLFDLLP